MFTLDEILLSISKLSNNKSTGFDGIPAEFYKNSIDDIAPVLLLLFNKILHTGIFPKSWGKSIITPIHKSGPKNIPSNYRGISITNTMYKIFAGVINKRLYEWAEEYEKIDESQAGFRRGYSAIDNIFCLQAMIQKYLSKKGGRFYCLYVDFRKAFDKINHSKLFEALERKGIHGHFLRILKSMYSCLESCVKVSNGTTGYFPCNIGTRQGDKTSSTIFALFIDELSVMLRENCHTGIFITNEIPHILCLLFADDVANCAETASKLQQQINIVELFCNNTGMEVNLDKTEIIVFRNGGPLRRYEKWLYGNHPIKTSPLYKYMGLIFTPKLSWNEAHEKLACQAQRALNAIRHYQKPFGYFPIKDFFKIFDTCIQPILCYGSQIWGYQYSSKIESIHNQFCRKLLYVRKTTNTCMVLGECGRLPLCITYYTNCIRYWCKLIQMPSYRYPKQCYLMLYSLDNAGRNCWATNVKSLLFRYGFGYSWISQNVGDYKLFIKMFRNRLIDCHTQDWHDNVNNSSRCHHYSYFKSLLNVERYLLIEMPLKHKIALSKFRCSNHNLYIEIGRHLNIPYNDRLCTACLENNIRHIDCEYHAFFQCCRYTDIRNLYLFNWYSSETRIEDFYNLLSSSNYDILRKLSVYVYHLMERVKM